MTEPYELGTAAPARRALADRLPQDVAAAAVEFITGPLLANSQRVGKALADELAGTYSARLGRDWRVLYEINDIKHAVIVLDIRPRSGAYRETHELLRRRVAAAHQSLQEYLRARLVEDAATPTVEEIMDRAGGRAGGSVSFAAATEALRDDRDRR